jgi:hypothetical protein
MKLNKEEEAVKASSSFLKTSSIESRFHSISHSIPENAHPKLFETLRRAYSQKSIPCVDGAHWELAEGCN